MRLIYHVGDCSKIFRCDQGNIKGGLEVRFIPAGKCSSTVRWLEIRHGVQLSMIEDDDYFELCTRSIAHFASVG